MLLQVGATWNGAGVIGFAPDTAGPLFRVSDAGGVASPVTALEIERQERSHVLPQFLPDGRHFIFLVRARPPDGGIYVAALDTSAHTRLLSTDQKGLYAPPRHLLFLRDGTLMAQPFDVTRLQMSGEPVPVVESVAFSTTNGRAAYSVSNTGVLAYRASGILATNQLSWTDRSGKSLSPVGAPGDYQSLRLSPDQSRLAVESHDLRLGTGDLWLLDLKRGSMSRFTFDGTHNNQAVWSPDGGAIVYAPTVGNRRRGFWTGAVRARGGIHRVGRGVFVAAQLLAGLHIDGTRDLTFALAGVQDHTVARNDRRRVSRAHGQFPSFGDLLRSWDSLRWWDSLRSWDKTWRAGLRRRHLPRTARSHPSVSEGPTGSAVPPLEQGAAVPYNQSFLPAFSALQCGSGGIGRRASLRSLCPQGRGGSSPLFRTTRFGRFAASLVAGRVQGRMEWCPERASASRGAPTVTSVYILRCSDDTFYVGHTDNLSAREALHNSGHGADYTASRRPVALVPSEQFESAKDAVKRERQLKRWSARKKKALIARDLPSLKASVSDVATRDAASRSHRTRLRSPTANFVWQASES